MPESPESASHRRAEGFSLSFIVPTFNRFHLLRRLLNSLEQSASRATCPVEVIVVDDGSTDPTSTLRAEDVACSVNVRILRQENSGPATARNRGARAAKGAFLAFVDDDCEVAADYVERLEVEATERGGVVFGGPALPREGATQRLSMAGRYLRATRALQDPITDGYGRIICLASANFVVRRDVFFEAGGFYERITKAGGEDMHLTWRLRDQGFPCRFLHDLVVFHDIDISLAELIRKFYGYGVGSAWAAHELGLAPQAVGLLTADLDHLLQNPIGHGRRLWDHMRYRQQKAWFEDLPAHLRFSLRWLVSGATLSTFIGGLVGGSAARSQKA